MGTIQDENSKEERLVLSSGEPNYGCTLDYSKTPGSVGFIGRKASKKCSVMEKRDLNLKLVKAVSYPINEICNPLQSNYKDNCKQEDSRRSPQDNITHSQSKSLRTGRQQYTMVNFESQGKPLAPMDSLLELDLLTGDNYTHASPLHNMIEISCESIDPSNERILLSMLDHECYISTRESFGLTLLWSIRLHSILRPVHSYLSKITLFQGTKIYNILRLLPRCKR